MLAFMPMLGFTIAVGTLVAYAVAAVLTRGPVFADGFETGGAGFWTTLP